MPPSLRQQSGDAVLNDSPGDCRSRGLTEPAGETVARRYAETEGVSTCVRITPSVGIAASSLKEGAFCRGRRLDAAFQKSLKSFVCEADVRLIHRAAVPLPQKGKVLKKTAGAVFCYASLSEGGVSEADGRSYNLRLKLLQSPCGASSLGEGAFCKGRRLDAPFQKHLANRSFAKPVFASSTARRSPFPYWGRQGKGRPSRAVFVIRIFNCYIIRCLIHIYRQVLLPDFLRCQQILPSL